MVSTIAQQDGVCSRSHDDVNLLGLTPVRAADWKEVGDRVVLDRPPPTAVGLEGLWKKLLFQMGPRRIRLDALGSYAWKRFDGTPTVQEVASELREQYGESVEPAEERLGQFVRHLRRGGLLHYSGPGQIRAPNDNRI